MDAASRLSRIAIDLKVAASGSFRSQMEDVLQSYLEEMAQKFTEHLPNGWDYKVGKFLISGIAITITAPPPDGGDHEGDNGGEKSVLELNLSRLGGLEWKVYGDRGEFSVQDMNPSQAAAAVWSKTKSYFEE